MTQDSLRTGAVLALLAVLPLVACTAADPREELDTFIDGSIAGENGAALHELVELRDRQAESFTASRVDLQGRLRELNSDYDASPAELTAVAEEFEVAWEEYRDGVIDAALEMRTLIEPDGWARFAELDAEVILHVGTADSDH